MGKIYCLLGKSSSGKDTLFKMLLEESGLALKTIVPYTTRPIRVGEQEGVEYHFVTKETQKKLEAEGKIIELRAYDTICGVWKYFTVDDGQIDLATDNYLVIGTLESYVKMRDYFGAEKLVPLYVEVEDGERLNRALTRERQQEVPRYAEMCRRFLADTEDFSEEHLRAAGIKKRYYNDDQKRCLDEIIEDIRYGKF